MVTAALLEAQTTEPDEVSLVPTKGLARHCQGQDPAGAKLEDIGKVDNGCSDQGDVTGDMLVNGLECILTRWVGHEVTTASEVQKKSGFFSPRQPRISLKTYLRHHIQKHCKCSDECFVLALVYISRITKMEPSITVCKLSVHRLLFFAVLLAIKFHDDERYSNRYYAKVGGMPIKEVNMLELNFLKFLHWKTVVQPDEYAFHLRLILQASRYEAPPHCLLFDEPHLKRDHM